VNQNLRRGLSCFALLFLLWLVSSAFTWLSMPCPLGPDLELPRQSVCERTTGGMGSSLSVGVIAGGLSLFVALLLALLGRWVGGVFDWLIGRFAELWFSVPDLLLLIIARFLFTLWEDANNYRLPSLWVMIFSLALVGWAAPTRMLQRRLESLSREEYVEASLALGATRWWVVRHHLLPAVRGYLVAIFLLRVPAAILAESTVSFLGFGLPPDQPSLGTYLGQNVKRLILGAWQVVVPSWVLLLLLVLAFHWVAQGLLASMEAPRERGKLRDLN
jgi:ABC-type dipeptide/oligopeptide/nickel transport system permease subunit